MKKLLLPSPFKLTTRFLLPVLILLPILGITGCSDKKKQQIQAEKTVRLEKMKAVRPEELKPILDTEPMPEFPKEKPVAWSKYHDDFEFKEFFKEPVAPPPFDFSVDCSNRSLAELRCLRNELFARHGYLFKDAVLRGYFNTNKWYQPIFWDDSFSVSLTKKEQWFVDKVLRLEKKHLARNYLQQGEDIVANTGNIVNTIQFPAIPDTLMAALAVNGFAVVKANHEQLFHVYDKNVYDCIPSYVTTDLYMQVLHMHYSNLMKKLETTMLYDYCHDMVTSIRNASAKIAASVSGDTLLQNAARFTWVYFAIGANLLSEEDQIIPQAYRDLYLNELNRIHAHTNMGSGFLDYLLFDFTQFKPRGHYTHSDSLSQYFKAVKWLLTAPFIVSTDRGLAAALVSAYCLRQKGIESYRNIDGFLDFLTGEPDNLSIMDLVEILDSDYAAHQISELVAPGILNEIRSKLLARERERIPTCAVSETATRELEKDFLFFLAGRYTFDAEILQRLVHCAEPEPKRPLPKGLDVFATLGNSTAQSILTNTYREQESWPPFDDTLRVLKKQFSSFTGWERNAYTRRMALFNSLFHLEDRYPYFMHLDAWNTRTLTCALAGWTQLKHEVILYAKQPSGAQCGEGGIPPPMIVGYVEPNTEFWKKAEELILNTSETLNKKGMETPDIAHIHKKLTGLASFLLSVSERELAKEALSDDDYDRIAYLGGEIEKLTLTIMDTDHFGSNDPERQIAIVTDVYTHNQTCLQEAIGYGNEIYVVVEINGLLHLTRGAVLSYYEFEHPSADRLTDKQWQSMLKDGKVPQPPVWTQEIVVPIKTLRTKPEYSHLIPGGC